MRIIIVRDNVFITHKLIMIYYLVSEFSGDTHNLLDLKHTKMMCGTRLYSIEIYIYKYIYIYIYIYFFEQKTIIQ